MNDVGFRALMPAFKDVDKALIDAQLTRAANHLDPTRWGDLLDEGTAYFVAHWLVVGGADKVLVEANDVIGRKTETLDLRRDPQLLAKQQANPYLRTTYGQHFQYLSDLIGVGALAVGGC